jgi:hypothetical protein
MNVILSINGELFDVYQILSITKDSRFDGDSGEWIYSIVVNQNRTKEASAGLPTTFIDFADEDERDKELEIVKEKLEQDPKVRVL